MIFNVQLVFDAADPDEVMGFWGRTLEYDNELVHMSPDDLREWRKGFPQYDGRGRIDDAKACRTPVYIQTVPEAKTGRNRLRPEIAVPDVDGALDRLRALGAVGTGADLADVEGNEFTVVRGDGEVRLRSIVFDSLDPDRMLDFWSQATGYEPSGNRCDPAPGLRTFENGSFVVAGTPFRSLGLNPAVEDGVVFDLVPGLAFVRTDEPKQTKNRLHIDLWNLDAEAERDRLIALGATVQRWDTDRVMLDPEGNEFCV
jgi:hypothetical protein